MRRKQKVFVVLPNGDRFSGLVLAATTHGYIVAHNSLRPDLGEWISGKFCNLREE